ncbi:MAG TPA: LysO family transporter [Haloplasmataceae bacterium]
MWFIYISLCLGIIIGAKIKLSEKSKKILDILTNIGIFTLLFVMGISIGINKEIISDIEKVGIVALIYTLLTVIFSVLIVYLFSFLLRGRK